MQDIEAVPLGTHHAGGFGDLAGEAEDDGAVGTRQRALAEDQHRLLGRLQPGREGMAAVGDGCQHGRIVAQMIMPVGQVDLRADRPRR